MPDLASAITAYEQAINDLTPSCDRLKVIQVLLARDSVATGLATESPTPAFVAKICDLDQTLKGKAADLNTRFGSAVLADWRDARKTTSASASFPSIDAWWWSLDARSPGEDWKIRGLNYIFWGGIVISLSFIVESLRRFLSGEVGVLGTVLQALVTLLVGSTIVEIAKQVTALQSGKAEGLKGKIIKRRFVLSILFVTIAFVMWFLLPQVVKYYSNRGVTERYQGELSNPISRYQRTISLDPSDAIAHYNLARAYESVAEYGKAEEEYKSAIRWDGRMSLAYDGLGHLSMAQKKDYLTGLRLVNSGLVAIEAQQKTNEFQSDDAYVRIRSSLLGNRAWAYFGLKYLTQSEDDLREVIKLRPNWAAPHCLLGQVLEEEAKIPNSSAKPDSDEIKKSYLNCIALSHDQGERIEPEWLALAQERTNEDDAKDSTNSKIGNAAKKQGKKP